MHKKPIVPEKTSDFSGTISENIWFERLYAIVPKKMSLFTGTIAWSLRHAHQLQSVGDQLSPVAGPVFRLLSGNEFVICILSRLNYQAVDLQIGSIA